MAPSRHDWKIVDWDVKPQHNQLINLPYKTQQIIASACITYKDAKIRMKLILFSMFHSLDSMA